MIFPGPNSEIYRNEAGEPIGWSNESSYEPEYCDYCGGAHNQDNCPDYWDDDDGDDEEYDDEP